MLPVSLRVAVQVANAGRSQLTNWTLPETSWRAVVMNSLLLLKLVVYRVPSCSSFWGCRDSRVPPDSEPWAGTCPVVAGVGVLGRKSQPLGGLLEVDSAFLGPGPKAF